MKEEEYRKDSDMDSFLLSSCPCLPKTRTQRFFNLEIFFQICFWASFLDLKGNKKPNSVIGIQIVLGLYQTVSLLNWKLALCFKQHCFPLSLDPREKIFAIFCPIGSKRRKIGTSYKQKQLVVIVPSVFLRGQVTITSCPEIMIVFA